jgi:MoaA/NifB/PqqE/SkfB family radical SAM enzyme
LLRLKSEDPGFLAVPEDFIRGFGLFFEGKAPKICHAGKLYVAIDPSGRLLACAARGDIVLGNVLEHSAAKLLRGEAEGDWRFRVASCLGCWLECTVGVSMTVEKPIKETLHMAGYIRRL